MDLQYFKNNAQKALSKRCPENKNKAYNNSKSNNSPYFHISTVDNL